MDQLIVLPDEDLLNVFKTQKLKDRLDVLSSWILTCINTTIGLDGCRKLLSLINPIEPSGEAILKGQACYVVYLSMETKLTWTFEGSKGIDDHNLIRRQKLLSKSIVPFQPLGLFRCNLLPFFAAAIASNKGLSGFESRLQKHLLFQSDLLDANWRIEFQILPTPSKHGTFCGSRGWAFTINTVAIVHLLCY